MSLIIALLGCGIFGGAYAAFWIFAPDIYNKLFQKGKVKHV